MKISPLETRTRVAIEAAALLYYSIEKDYKQAKEKAAKNQGVSLLPSNREIALELDQINEEIDGVNKKEHLIQMRIEALNIMNVLKDYSPILIGSVWRGIIRKGSDIDIAVYHDFPTEIPNILDSNGLDVSKTQWVTVTKRGKTETSFHIYLTLGTHMVEITVRSSEEVHMKRKCEVFGDEIKGLKPQELSRVLADNPARKFLPI